MPARMPPKRFATAPTTKAGLHRLQEGAPRGALFSWGRRRDSHDGMIRAAPLLLALAFLAACAVPEARLRAGLINAGLSEPLAACMAERMVDRLSLIQLRRIGDLPQARGAVSVADFLHRVRALRDPEILAISSSAAALCAAGLARR
jgi:hypothetical protein